MIRFLIAILMVLVTAGTGGGLASAQEARTCSQFASQAEAQVAYAAAPGDPVATDEDRDGVACENVTYGNSTTDLTPLRRIGAAGMTGTGGSSNGGIGAPGMVLAAQPSEQAVGGIGAAGITQPAEVDEGGIGAAGITPASNSGVGAPGMTGGQRAAVVGTMTAMPNTGTGGSGAGSSWVAVAFLLAAAGAAGASCWSSMSSGQRHEFPWRAAL